MSQQIAVRSREAVLVEDPHVQEMMGFEILEPVPTWNAPYEQLDGILPDAGHGFLYQYPAEFAELLSSFLT